MMKKEIPGGDTNSWARACDTCRSAPCTVYCKADSAYLCTSCDARIHAANQLASRHERVWVCEACERAPAAFLCKADAASLCATCDADIHSANPLARRHHRVPIMPVGCTYGPSDGRMSEDGFLDLAEGDDQTTDHEGDEDEAASWLLLNPGKNSNNQTTNGFLTGRGEVDEYLDLFEYNSGAADNQFCEQYNQQQEFSVPEKSCEGDSVVPVQCREGKDHQIQYQNFLFGMECETKSEYNYNTPSSHSVSVSSLDVGVVPESTMSDMSVSHPRPPKGTIDLFSSPPMQVPTQLSPLDREARVMRYREKKKNRKFEKTIRYASRKAYAETRPRIKGRFAKRTDVEAEMDQMFTNSLMSDGGYGIVPSF
ncbi:zinc finger protein CONSTANS-LIKE 2-like isoform X1 [Chenopodium quinoa]|uniref:zinc finger protein CONSTANS-LIKE 2-like isoform X1 n=1 Tax=Chenopodium quinoa TaxID=63459 RepID=UPI000B794C91|nr:zinc finger protein CONSTANS-LIKE 2-like isoform X1 [Chenopodium quinoa]